MPSHPAPRDSHEPFWRSRNGIVVLMLLVIGLFYVVREHVDHAIQALPYLILLLCPLMHLFGHGHGHGTHRYGGQDEER